MATYKIELLLSGKNQLANVMNNAAGSVKGGIDKIKASATGANKSLESIANNGKSAFMAINYGAESAVKSVGKVGDAGSKAGSQVAKGGEVGAKGLNKVSSAGKGAIDTMDGLSGVIGGVVGGFGLMEIATASWTGSTTKQFNKAYLETKMSSAAADQYISQIQQIVAEVPGDDTFMNNLMTGAVAKQTNLTTAELKMMGIASADYLTTSQAMGKSQMETQMDLKEYILTGNTSQLERDSILKQQMSTLEGQGTVSERILALNKALQAEGYAGLSQLDIASIKAEELKGKFQLAATAVGEKILPYIEKFLDYILELDQQTGGLSTQIGLLAGAAIAAGGALALIASPIKSAVDNAKDLVGWIRDKIPSTKTTTIKCVRDPGCDTPTAGAAGANSGRNWGGITALSLAGVVAIYVTHAAIQWSKGRLEDPNYTPTAGGKPLSDSDSTEGKSIKDQIWSVFRGDRGLQGLAPTAPIGLDVAFQNFDIAKWIGGNLGKGGLQGLLVEEMTKNLNLGNLGGLIKGGLPRIIADGLSGLKFDLGAGGLPGIIADFLEKNLGTLGGLGKGGLPGIISNWLKNKFPNIGTGAGLPGIIADALKGKIPSLKWPTIEQIFSTVNKSLPSKIPELIWKIPGVSSIGDWIRDKITTLGWSVPGWGDLAKWAQDKITWLAWNIPGMGQILDIISSKIPGFSWPWGPGGGSRASTAASNVANRARVLLSQGPRGPINDTIVNTMSARSGVGSGYISQALANRFSGLAGFNPIADGMAAPLSYEFYMNGQKTNQQVWESGTCNCYDGAEFLQSEARARFGLDAGLTPGLWNGTSIPHTWATIGGQPFDMAAKLLRGHWNPPSGPGADFAQFMTDIGPGLEYLGYPGHGKDPYSALNGGGNCFDMTLGIMDIASNLFGLPSEMIWGTYDGNSHVWARIAGKDYDLSRKALANTYTPPPSGPTPIGGNKDVHVHIHYEGEVYGFEDFETKTKAMVSKGLDERTMKNNRIRFGG